MEYKTEPNKNKISWRFRVYSRWGWSGGVVWLGSNFRIGDDYDQDKHKITIDLTIAHISFNLSIRRGNPPPWGYQGFTTDKLMDEDKTETLMQRYFRESREKGNTEQ